MLPSGVQILALDDPDHLTDLAAEAQIGGHRMVRRLIEEWRDGRNRFDAPGESVFTATINGRIVGVVGLNRDPFADDVSVGRVRRLYVAADHRRSGIATALMAHLVNDAKGHFRSLHLRTHDPIAAAFYAAVGFKTVTDNDVVTHCLALPQPDQ
ncbi:MAG TPA: GNAT family N-acetyltransferase [Tepidisphaeraceae bacterium]|jgi:GNAT superfamily N-acetyltransferase